MADDELNQKLIYYVEDAHAMEQNVSTTPDSMISTTGDPEITDMLEHHKAHGDSRLAAPGAPGREGRG